MIYVFSKTHLLTCLYGGTTVPFIFAAYSCICLYWVTNWVGVFHQHVLHVHYTWCKGSVWSPSDMCVLTVIVYVGGGGSAGYLKPEPLSDALLCISDLI
jgi:hypothetical protein